jgi:hypothetical protein
MVNKYVFIGGGVAHEQMRVKDGVDWVDVPIYPNTPIPDNANYPASDRIPIETHGYTKRTIQIGVEVIHVFVIGAMTTEEAMWELLRSYTEKPTK